MQRADRLAALHVAAHQLSTSDSELDIVAVLAAHIEALCGGRFWVALYESEADIVDMRFCVMDGQRTPEWEVRKPAGTGLGGEVGRTGATIATVDYVDECARRGVAPDSDVPEPSTRPNMPWLGVPIVGRQQVLGILCVFERPGHPIDTGCSEVLQTLALHASIALEHVRQRAAELTERARVDARVAVLQESETRYRSLVELSPDAILVHVDGLVVFANVAAVQLFEARDAEQLVGTPVMDWVHADSRASVLQRVGNLQRLGAEVPAVEERLVRADGTPIEVDIAASAVFYQGRHAIQVVVRDITERKLVEEALRASEERFRKQYKNIPLPTYSWCQLDDDFVLADYNDAAEAIVGGGIRDWLGVRASIRYAAQPEILADIRACLSEQRTIRREGRYEYPDTGRLRDTAVTYVFVPPLTVMIHTEDLTDARQAEQQGKALAQSEKLRALGQMASGIAHDLNQSLMLITSYSDLAHQALLLDPPDLAELGELLTTATQAALDGGESVKRLLLFSRAAPEHVFRQVNLGKIVSEAAQLTAPRWRDEAQAEGRPISLRVLAESDLTIQGSPSQLRELMTNVIFNAIDALPTGGTIGLRVVGEDSNGVVEVTDSGIGMSAEVQQRVFEPFFTTKGEGGTGLGLAMVFGIVKQHGGYIGVRSTPGAGTTFRITLPLVQATVDQVAALAAPAQMEPPRPLRVLVVDDEPMMTRAVIRMLKPSGHVVRAAASGEEALKTMSEHTFDVVVSDVGMGPGMNGWELVDAVKRLWPGVRFLLATGWGAAIDPAEARTRGVDAVLSKPYHPADLLAILADPRPVQVRSGPAR